jgi:hypothetical protein
MGKRGENAFKRNDAIRALQSARSGGLEPAMMEVVLGADGTTTFRIFGDKAATETTQGAAEWNAEIAKLKAATPKGGKGNEQIAAQICAGLQRWGPAVSLLPEAWNASHCPSGAPWFE